MYSLSLCYKQEVKVLTCHRLHIDLEPTSLHYDFDADIYVVGIEGRAQGEIDVKNGVSFAAAMNPVNLYNLIKIT